MYHVIAFPRGHGPTINDGISLIGPINDAGLWSVPGQRFVILTRFPFRQPTIINVTNTNFACDCSSFANILGWAQHLIVLTVHIIIGHGIN